MAFEVNQFRSQMALDGARPNLFQVTMQFPSALVPGGAADASKKITFHARAAQIPGSTINSIPIQYFGREVKLAGNRTFQDWTLTIFNDEDFVTRNALEQWMASLNSHTGNLRAANARSSFTYGVDALVQQYAKTGEIIKTYKFIGLFPVDLSPIDLDWGANDTLEEYTATFAFQYWTAEDIGIR